MKKIVKLIKNICIAIFILYGMNVILSSVNVMVPINVYSIGIVSILQGPGLIALIMMYFII